MLCIVILLFALITETVSAENRTIIEPSVPIWCCFHGFHYHECYERVNSEGCVIGSSIVWPRPKHSTTNFVFGSSFKTLQYPTMNGGFMVCSDVPECAPTEAGGAFLRGVIKNCPECASVRR